MKKKIARKENEKSRLTEKHPAPRAPDITGLPEQEPE
jgi:hypothetical protein